MSERNCSGKESCCACGSDEYREAVFSMGRLFCAACWRLVARTQRQAPPTQQTFNLVQATQTPRAP
jgi:hypothetical protein